VAVGALIGGVVVNLVNIMDPEIEMDYEVAIAFFSVMTWGALSLIDTLFRKVRPTVPAAPSPTATTSAAPAAPTAPGRR
jgi:hypothetical protein